MIPAHLVLSIDIRNASALADPHDNLPRAVALFLSKMAFLAKREIAAEAPRGRPPAQRRHPLSSVATSPGSILAETVEVLTPVAGQLGRGWNARFRVGPTAQYASHVVFGTRPHPILPRRAKVLTIYRPGAEDADEYGWVHRKRVNHPGSEGNDFLTRGVNSIPVSDQDRAWGQALKQAGVL